MILMIVSCDKKTGKSYFSIAKSKQHLRVGDAIDSLNGVKVYYNGKISNTCGRNVAKDGYNLGKKYQCVEFVKRYYYEHLHHKMPDSYGHAVDFFNKELTDGAYNIRRGLKQFQNPSHETPKPDDLVVYDGTSSNPYGHVAIVSRVMQDEIEIIQQNPGPSASSRVKYNLIENNGYWRIDNNRILGWLRK